MRDAHRHTSNGPRCPGNRSGLALVVTLGFTVSCGAPPAGSPEPENVPPTVTPANVDVWKNEVASIELPGVDSEGDVLSYSITEPPRYGTATLDSRGADGTLVTYTPNAGFSGLDEIGYRVSDGTDEVRGTVKIHVVDRPPSLDGPTAIVRPAMEGDRSVTLRLSATDPDGDVLRFEVASAPVRGSLSAFVPVAAEPGEEPLAPASTLMEVTYTPDQGSLEGDSFSVVVTDGTNTTDAHSIEVLVNGAPSASQAAATARRGQPITIALEGTDPDGDALSFELVDLPESGTLGALTPTGPANANVVYTPGADSRGTVTFSYRVRDALDSSTPAEVSVTIEEQPPFASASLISLFEDLPMTVRLTGHDPDGTALTFTILEAPLHVTLGALEMGGEPVHYADVLLTPDPDFHGEDALTYQVTNEAGLTATATVAITVTPVNDPPSFTSGGDVVVDEDAGPQSLSWASEIRPGPSDEAAQTVHFEVEVLEHAELFETPPAIASDGTLTFLTAEDAYGTATVLALARDDGGTQHGGRDTSEPTTFVITVSPVDDPPRAHAQQVGTDEDVPITVQLTGSDPDGDHFVFEILEPPEWGSLSEITHLPGGTAEVTFTPEENRWGTVTFTFAVNDGTSFSAPATVSVNVRWINDRPTVTVDGVLITPPGETEPGEVSTYGIPEGELHDVYVNFADAEALDENNDAHSPYFFRIAPISWPPFEWREQDEPNYFTWKNFDINEISKDTTYVRPDFYAGDGGFIQFSSSVGIAHYILNNLEFVANVVGEYVVELTIIDNGFRGRCPEDLVRPDPAELATFHPEDYRRVIGREGDLVNGNVNRCIRETTTFLRLGNTSNQRTFRFRTSPFPTPEDDNGDDEDP